MRIAFFSMALLTTISFLSRRSSAFIARRAPHHRQLSKALSTSMTASSIIDEEQLVQDMLYRIRQINHMPDDARSSLIDFQVDGLKLGKVHPRMAQTLCTIDTGSPPVFELKQGPQPYLTLSAEAGKSPDSRTHAVASVMEQLRNEGIVKGWRDELFAVSESFYDPTVFLMERAAVNVLGVLEYGVHINGLVQESMTDEPKMWIARRSATKSKFPGMLDHLVAGGQPAGLGLLKNVIKECEEEAGIPEQITRAGVQSVGAISYEQVHNDKVSRVVLFNYDLYLPNDFVPTPVDGEAQEFFLWTIDQVKESITADYHDPVKPNCYVVIIDYLLRMGYISPEVPGYLDVLRELRNGDCR